MKVLSLFDGMSCGQIALDQLGIPVDKYYASEIDKYAIKVTQANYPNTIQVGDVCNLNAEDYKDVDLIQAGSPCQGFSFAGKQLAFDDPRSALFFEFIRLLKDIKPKYFLLENVRMKKEFLEIITEQVSQCYKPEDVDNQFLNVLGEVRFEPIFINSSLLSAQSRQRYYWTNIPGIKQPEDRGIVLRDILEDNFESERNKAHCIDANYYKGASVEQYKKKHRRQLVNKPTKEYISAESVKKYVEDVNADFNDPYNKKTIKGNKSTTLRTNSSNGNMWVNDKAIKQTKPIKVGMNVEEVKVRKHEVDILLLQQALRAYKKNSKKTNKQIADETNMPITKVEHWFRTDSSFAIPSDNIWFKLKEVLGFTSSVFDKQIMEFEYRDGVYESTQRVYSDQGKSPTLTASNKEQMIETKPQQVGVAVDINGHDILKRVYSPDGKSPTVNTCQGGNREPKVVTGGAFRGRAYDKDGKRMDKDGVSVANKTKQMLELRQDSKSNAITTVGKDSVVVKKLPDKSQTIKSQYFKSSRANFERQGTFHATGVQHEDLTWRKLTPLECERLQTVPDNYTNQVSNTQRYKMLGNGWTVEVIKHIYKNMA
jgi:DNA-cytosine methyltransferase